MPRKKLRETRDQSANRPSQTKNNRIRAALNKLVGIEDPDDLMLELLGILTKTEKVPTANQIYTFVYIPKTRNIQYDPHPLVAVTDVFSWGFRGLNYHWGGIRQYSWKEIIGDLHLVYTEELADVRELPFGKISLS
jgi:hypothetical protein